MALVETNQAAVDAERNLQAYYLAMFDRIFPPGYMVSIKSPGPGYELFQAFAKMAERLSLAVAHSKVAGLILTAAGGQQAQCNVTFTRSSPGTNAVTIKAGTVVRASKGQRDFALMSDVAFSASDLGPHTGTVQAVANGYEWNIPGPKTTITGAVLPGEIDTLYSPVLDPPFGDATFAVAQQTDATGGQDAALDQLGLDRNLPRTTGEPDAAYGLRITSLPDTVSPGAFTRLVSALLSPYGVSATLIELSSITLQTVWDAPANSISANANYSPTLFAYDDTRTTNPIGGAPVFFDRWLSGRVGGIVLVPEILVKDQGMAFDDTANTVASFAKRAIGAWDVPGTLATGELQGAYDGVDYGAATVYLGVYNSLQAIKAAGVPINVELSGQ